MEKHEKELYENALQMIDELQEKEEKKEKVINDLLGRIANLEREVERLNKENAILKQTMFDESLLITENALLKDRIKEVREELKILKELEDFSVVKLQLTNIIFRLDKENEK